MLHHYYYYCYYQFNQIGTGRHTQKAQTCTRCLPIAKEPRSYENLKQQIGRDKSSTEKNLLRGWTGTTGHLETGQVTHLVVKPGEAT